MGIPIEEDMDASIQQFKAAASIANWNYSQKIAPIDKITKKKGMWGIEGLVDFGQKGC